MTIKDLPQPQPPEDPQAKMDRISKAAKEATIARNKTIFDVIWRRAKERKLDKGFPQMVENMNVSDRERFKMFSPYVLEDMEQSLEGSEALRVAFVAIILDRERKFFEEEIHAGNGKHYPTDTAEVYENEWAPVQETFMMQVLDHLPELEREKALRLANQARRTIDYKVPFSIRPEDSLLFYSAFKAGEIPPFQGTIDDATQKAA